MRDRSTQQCLLASPVLAIGLILSIGPDALLVLVIGPVVAVAALARALGLSDELPEVLRLEQLNPGRVLIGGTLAVALFFGLLILESMVVGPDLRADGAHGWLTPKVLGFNAQPMRAFDVDAGGEPASSSTWAATRTSTCSSTRATTTRSSSSRSGPPAWS